MQILTGFLLTVPFSNRFVELTDFQRNVYLAVLAGSIITTGLVVAPVAFHRVLFRQRRRSCSSSPGNRFAMAGLGMLALTVSGAVLLVVDLVLGRARGGSPAARSSSGSCCSGPRAPRHGQRRRHATQPAAGGQGRRDQGPGADDGDGEVAPANPSASASDAVVEVDDVPHPLHGQQLEVGEDPVRQGSVPPPTTTGWEQVDVVDEPGTEGLSGEGGAADAHVEDTARLELLDAGRVEG